MMSLIRSHGTAFAIQVKPPGLKKGEVPGSASLLTWIVTLTTLLEITDGGRELTPQAKRMEHNSLHVKSSPMGPGLQSAVLRPPGSEILGRAQFSNAAPGGQMTFLTL